MNLYVCPTCAKALTAIADAVNGPKDGPPDAITIGNLRLFFVPPSAALERHEKMHTVQCERFCPRWLRWLPWRSRVWAGTGPFLRWYVILWTLHGYQDHPLEIEARSAEGS